MGKHITAFGGGDGDRLGACDKLAVSETKDATIAKADTTRQGCGV